MNLGWIKLCRSLDDYIEVTSRDFEVIEGGYSTLEEFQQGAFALFTEYYIKFFEKNLVNIKYTPTKLEVDFCGEDENGNASTVLSLFKSNDKDITSNADKLNKFFANSRQHYGVKVENTNNLYVVSNALQVNEQLLKNAPTIKNKVRFILFNELVQNVTNNLNFWNGFANATIKDKKVNTTVRNNNNTTQYTLRKFQTEAVDSMLSNKIGQVILPTGTGKSVIQAEYCRRYITERNTTPIILIISPRIVLTYQLLNVVFNHLSSHKIDARYVNLSSGDMEKISQEMMVKMESEGLLPHKIEATTDIRYIKQLIESSKDKSPLVISATYHSAWRLTELDSKINVILCDEAHNIVMGRFSDEFKKETRNLKSDSKFFFTATPCETPSDDGNGMNNAIHFGSMIYSKAYVEMIEANEILPICIQTVNVDTCLILKNKSKGVTTDNLKDADFDRDVTCKVKAITEAFDFHGKTLTEVSCDPSKIAPKLLATIDGVGTLKGILKSEEIEDLYTNQGIHVFAISTDTKYFHNGVYEQRYDFKEKFMQDIKALKDTDKAIILHIDMIGEGLDVSGITSVMAFSTQGVQKLVQLFGRAMRLHDVDRVNLYSKKFYKGMDRTKMMVKPYCYMIVPMFLDESKDLKSRVTDYIKKIHEAYDFIPYVSYDQTAMIGDNELLNNQNFKGKHEEYEVLTFKHEIELNNLRALFEGYTPDISL